MSGKEHLTGPKSARSVLSNAWSAAHRGDMNSAKNWIKEAEDRIDDAVEEIGDDDGLRADGGPDQTGKDRCWVCRDCDDEALEWFKIESVADQHAERTGHEVVERRLCTDGGEPQESGSEQVECPECGGDGLVRNGCTQEGCPICQGDGAIPSDHWRIADDVLGVDGGDRRVRLRYVSIRRRLQGVWSLRRRDVPG